MARAHSTIRGGFTLVEVLIVLIILAIVASVLIAMLNTRTNDARDTAFVSALRTYASLFRIQQVRSEAWPPDVAEAVIPTGMDQLLDDNWVKPTPIGGRWDWDHQQFGIVAGISVHLPDRTDAQMQVIDKSIDDGNLDTGSFRRRTNGYIFILQQ